MIIGLTGTLGAGKGTVADYLLDKGFKHYSVRNFLIKEIKKRGMPVNRDSMVIVANDLRAKHTPSYIIEELYKQAKQQGGNAIIESIRAPGEAEAIKKLGGRMFAIDADQRIRYDRITARASETDQVSFKEFKMNEEREMTSTDSNKQNLARCISMSDHILNNNGTINDLKKEVDKILEEIEDEEGDET
jgi:dephospho-CoA kinase